MHLLIYLKNRVQAFTITPAQVSDIQSHFPDWTITHVTSKQDFLAALPEAEMCILWTMKQDWYTLAPRLQAIYTPAAGRDWVESDPRGQVQVHHGHFHGLLMSETLLAMMLYWNRRINACVQFQAARQWEPGHLSHTVPLRDQTVAILGYGAIGRHCARVLQGFGTTVWGVKRSPRDTALDRDAQEILSLEALRERLGQIDHLVFILPGGEETQGIFTREDFSLLKRGCYIYNLGRGNCYIEKDLLWALEEGIIAGAGLDVFAEEPLPESSLLWQHPGVLILPHASAVNSQYVPLFLEEFYQTIASEGK